MKVLYYALGGGHGHAVRALAAVRGLAGAAVIVPARFKAWAEGTRAFCVPERQWEPASLGSWVRRTVSEFSPDVTLVDVFPRGVLGELSGDLLKSAWLVGRWVRPDFYLKSNVRRAIEEHYQGLIWCEEPPAELECLRVRQERVPPILIRSPGECFSRDEARRELGAGPGDRVLLSLLGDGERRRVLEKVCGRLGLVLRTPEGVFPAVRYFRAADVLVAAGGYHAFHEARMLGVPRVFLPERRLYDDQFLRVRGERTASSPEELEAAVGAALAGEPPEVVPVSDGAAALRSLIGSPEVLTAG